MNIILVGAQWGDEGKGKIIDILTEDADIVVRSQGGNNAGHTVEVGSDKFVLHLIPSGILRADKTCVIANGVVVDPVSLVAEIDGLTQRGIKAKGRLFLSETAHVVMPYHRKLDGAKEEAAGSKKIGTTKRGIGPTYADKASRTGFRVGDLLRKDFPERLRQRLAENNELLKTLGQEPLEADQVLADYQAAAAKLKPYITNTVLLLHEAIRSKRKLLFEGAQGTYLDLDFGTYPYVTSSNTTAGGACTGSGVPPHRIDRVVGVMKAYTTRVGEGPFPTENKQISDMLHAMGREFGATTGRARRCGWFDSVATRYAAALNGIDELAVTNLDGLDQVPEIKVCIGYQLGSKKIDYVPTDVDVLARVRPVYQTFPGWMSPTSAVRSFRKLPAAAQVYLRAIAELTGAKLRLISVGPNREETFRL